MGFMVFVLGFRRGGVWWSGLMTDLEKLLELAKERAQLQAAWYRQILTLAAGGLALLVGLAPQAPPDGLARWLLAAAWVLLGAGILSGAAATYAEVDRAERLTAAFQSRLGQRNPAPGNPPAPGTIVARPHGFFLACKKVMVISLLGAVVCLVAFSVMRTLG